MVFKVSIANLENCTEREKKYLLIFSDRKNNSHSEEKKKTKQIIIRALQASSVIEAKINQQIKLLLKTN